MTVFSVPSTRIWINKDGSPTNDFFLFITALFKQTAGAGAQSGTILSNISGGVAAPVSNTLSAVLDATIGSAEGDIAVRGSALWAGLSLGSVNKALVSNGTDLVYASIVNSLNGVNGISFSSSTGAVSVSLTSALVLAAGAPASINTAGGNLQIKSATGVVVLGTASGGIVEFGQPAKSAAVATNFSAARFITVLDGTGTIYYVPAATTPW